MGRTLLVLGEVIALGVAVAISASIFTATESLSIVLSMMVAYLVPRFVYSQSNVSCRWGQWLLLIVATALTVYIIYNLKAITIDTGETLEMPTMHSDDGRYYQWALANYDGRCPEPKVLYQGVPLIMLGLWKLLGVSVVWPIALNLMFTLLTIVMTGKIANRLLSHRFESTSPSTITAVAMLMVSLLGFFMSQGVRIQKEASCAFSFILVGFALAGMSLPALSKKERNRDMLLFLFGAILMSLVRTNFVYFFAIGAAMMAFANHRAQWKRCTIMAVVALGFTFLFNFIFDYTLEHQYVLVNGGEAMARDFKIGTAQQPYVILFGEYYYAHQWERILLLPLTMGVQYIIPFPWLYDYSDATVFSLLPRMRFMWYIAGGACIFYYLYISVLSFSKKIKISTLRLWAWWPFVTFMLMSYITGGLVSRYTLPIQPLFMVVALYVFLHLKEGHFRRSFLIWMIVYFFILVATLIFSYHTQLDYLRSLKMIH